MLGWIYYKCVALIKSWINKDWQRFQYIKQHNIRRFYTQIRKRSQQVSYTIVRIFIYLELITVRSICWSKYQVPSIMMIPKHEFGDCCSMFSNIWKWLHFYLITCFPIIICHLAFGKNRCFWKIVNCRVGLLHVGGTIVW